MEYENGISCWLKIILGADMVIFNLGDVLFRTFSPKLNELSGSTWIRWIPKVLLASLSTCSYSYNKGWLSFRLSFKCGWDRWIKHEMSTCCLNSSVFWVVLTAACRCGKAPTTWRVYQPEGLFYHSSHWALLPVTKLRECLECYPTQSKWPIIFVELMSKRILTYQANTCLY